MPTQTFQSPDDRMTETQFMRLFLKHEPVLRCVARSMLSDWQQVDDVLQEAGVTMWEKIDQLDAPENFLFWARVIVRLKCRSVLNASRRDRLVLSEEAIQLIADKMDLVDREQYEVTLQALRGCLAKLQPHQRQLVMAPYREDEQIQQIAEAAGKTPNSLYKRLGRLRQKLSQCVEYTLRTEA